MRSRPDIDIELDPRELLPGRGVDITLVLKCGGETPYDAIHVRLAGTEKRALDRIQGSLTHHTRETVQLRATLGPAYCRRARADTW